MSYNVRDDNATFGSLASVELLNGAGAPTLACIQSYEPVALEAATATTFAASSFNTVFIAPPSPTLASGILNLGGTWQILGGIYRYGTAGGAGSTFSIEVVPAGTADGSGNNVLSTTNISLNTAASNTPTPLSLNTNINNLLIKPSGRININAGASATTGLANFTVMLYVARIS